MMIRKFEKFYEKKKKEAAVLIIICNTCALVPNTEKSIEYKCLKEKVTRRSFRII
jgi:hypothetical protein